MQMFQIAELSKKTDVCALCEEYTSKAIDYLNENKTQQEVIDILHNTCHQLASFKQKVAHLMNLSFSFRYCNCSQLMQKSTLISTMLSNG